MPITLPVRTFKPSDFEGDLTFFNQWATEVVQAINAATGKAGAVVITSELNMQGNKVTNVAPPTENGDLVTLNYAQSNFGASAVRPQIEATGATPLQSYRRLNDVVQREKSSSFLNSLMSTPVATNSATIYGSTSGGSTMVTVSAGTFQRTDGTTTPFASRTDTFTNPTSYTILTLSRSGGIVTATLSSSFSGANGSQIIVAGASDTSFDGTFVVASGSGTSTITWDQNAVAATATGGSVSIPSTYYYVLSNGSQYLTLVPATAADTWEARLAGSYDGSTIVAVAALTSSGFDAVNSGGGASAPQTGASIPVIRRF